MTTCNIRTGTTNSSVALSPSTVQYAVGQVATVVAAAMISAASTVTMLDEDTWAAYIGADAEWVDLSKWSDRLEKRSDKQFIWQTCHEGDRRIKSIKVFHCPPNKRQQDPEMRLQLDTVLGKTRLCAIVRVGDELNGHHGLLHGGFTAALLDDLLGLLTGFESRAQKFEPSRGIFTANLLVNYRRPLPCDAEYLVEVEVDNVVRSKKVNLKAVIIDRHGNKCVDATSLYIIKDKT